MSVPDLGVHPYLRCPACKEPLKVPAVAACASCGKHFEVEDGIVSMNADGARTALDDIDYDAMYRVDAGASAHIVQVCCDLLGDRLPSRVGGLLEVGAGTGLFTLGFLKAVPVEQALITDISPAMLKVCRRRLDADPDTKRTRVEFATWDGSQPCFREEAFDMAAGFSVVHHVLDYAALFGELHDCLKADGFALFLEPSYRFHAVLVDFMAEILYSVPQPHEAWTDADRNAVSCWLYENHVNLRFCGDVSMLRDREDKHLFKGEDVRAAAEKAGFRSTELIPFGGRNECLTAIAVYTDQMGIGAAARNDLMARCERHLPGPFVHLAEEDRAPSFLILLRKGDAAWSSRLAPSEYRPPNPSPRFRFDLAIEMAADAADTRVSVNGWVFGDVDASYILMRGMGGECRFPIHRLRPDVQEILNADRSYPLRRVLFSGVQTSLSAPFQADSSVDILIRGVDGHEHQLANAQLRHGSLHLAG